MKQLIKSIAGPAIKKWVLFSEKRSYPGMDIENPETGNKAVKECLKTSMPASIGKIGGFELNIIKRYLRNTRVTSNLWTSGMHRMNVNAGIFPEDTALIKEYCEDFLDALKDINILGIWFNAGEAEIAHKFCTNAQYVNYSGIEPFSLSDPWVSELECKNVLVIHPFAKSIKMQYEKRDLIWGERKLLPDFNLLQIKMPLSNAMVPSGFANWRELLDDIKRQMDSLEYDITLVGAGGYSLLITQHAKQSGKIGIHLGGVTQILFGICGARWMNTATATRDLFFNEHWVRPLPEETPQTSNLVENGCYW